MGFLLAGNGLLVLWITIQVYHRVSTRLHCNSLAALHGSSIS